jgi:DNA-directed RNA polymerase subunit omega
MQGSRPTISTKFTKETTVAIDEMVQGRLEFLTGTEARQAMKDMKRKRESEFDRIATTGTALGEDAREIKKELSVYVDDSPKAPEVEPEATAGPEPGIEE